MKLILSSILLDSNRFLRVFLSIILIFYYTFYLSQYFCALFHNNFLFFFYNLQILSFISFHYTTEKINCCNLIKIHFLWVVRPWSFFNPVGKFTRCLCYLAHSHFMYANWIRVRVEGLCSTLANSSMEL